MTPELLSLPYSPWSERARWALDARGVVYVRKRFQPLLGEPALRVRLRRFSGRVSVPVLFTDDGHFADSVEIARWANTQGRASAPDLFPAVHEEATRTLQLASDTALEAGRSLALRRVLASDAALADLVPPPLRRLGSIALAIARSGVRRTLSKYGVAGLDSERAHAELHGALTEIRRFVPKGNGTRPIFGTLTFADITAAQALTFIMPVVHPAYRIAEASRSAFEDAPLKSEFADLLEWRDALYAGLRAP